MSEYIPTTQDVREAFAEHQAWRASPTYGKATSCARFDLWLSAHEAKVKAELEADLADAEAKLSVARRTIERLTANFTPTGASIMGALDADEARTAIQGKTDD